MKKKYNIRQILLVLAVIIFTLPVLAQGSGLQPGDRGDPEQITLYGTDFTIVPYRMSLGVYLSWEDAKPFLPDEIFAKPEEPMTQEQAYQKFYDVFMEYQVAYEVVIKHLAQRYMEDHPGEFDSMDAAERQVAGLLHEGDEYNVSDPDAQKMHDIVAAMMYLSNMLGESLYDIEIIY